MDGVKAVNVTAFFLTNRHRPILRASPSAWVAGVAHHGSRRRSGLLLLPHRGHAPAKQRSDILRRGGSAPGSSGPSLSNAWTTCGSTSAAFFAIPAAVASDTGCETSAISLRASFSPSALPW